MDGALEAATMRSHAQGAVSAAEGAVGDKVLARSGQDGLLGDGAIVQEGSEKVDGVLELAGIGGSCCASAEGVARRRFPDDTLVGEGERQRRGGGSEVVLDGGEDAAA